ncbi:MAG: TonB-dependent receptor [Melioribacteraceae bacterium]|nr:TonB-dependent receptor [Melioribacteraceae bacterium]
MKKITNLILAIILFTGLNNAQTQTSILKGKITDSKTNEVLVDAIVFISYNFMNNTNGDGEFLIKNIPFGEYVIKVSRIGYKSVEKKISISEETQILNINLEPSLIRLNDIIVSSDRNEHFVKNSVYSVNVISDELIEEKSFNTVSDALSNEAGISLMRDGIWGTEINIRGLSKENVVALIDGNRVSTSTDVSARLSMIDMNDIDRVEVIKGASSSIYGSGATGGVINIVTKEPEMFSSFRIRGNVSSGINSVNNLLSTSGNIFLGDESWSAKLSGSYRKAENTQTPSGELKNSQFEDYSYSASLNYSPFDENFIKVNYQSFKAIDVGIPGASVFPVTADVRYPDEKRELFSIGYEIQNLSKVIYKISLKYSNQFIGRNVENIPNIVQNIPANQTSPARRVSVLKIAPNAEHKSNNIQLQTNFMLSKQNNLITGIDYWDRTYSGNRERFQKIEVLNAQNEVVNTINKVFGEKPLPNSKYSSIGVYAQNDNQLIENKLNLSLGGRVDFIKVTGEKTLNPLYEITNGILDYDPSTQKVIWNEVEENNLSYSANAGLRYSLLSNLDLTLSAGLSFRSPSLEERFQYIDQGSFVRIGTPDLKSEQGKSLDLGLRYYQSNLKVISSVFYNYFDNLVAEVPGTFEGRNAFIKTNIGKARLYGFEIDTEYNFYDDYLVYASAAFVNGYDITNDDNLPEIPPFNGMIGFRFELIDFLKADFNSIFTADQNKTAQGEVSTPGYAYFNIYLTTELIRLSGIGIQFSGGIENLFNKEYRNHLSTNRGFIKSEPGRNLFLKMNLNW